MPDGDYRLAFARQEPVKLAATGSLSVAALAALCDAGEAAWRRSGRGKALFRWRGRRFRAIGCAFSIKIETARGRRFVIARFWR